MIGRRRRLPFLAPSPHLRALALSLGAIGAAAGCAHAEVQNVRIALDWIIQGTHAPFFVAKDRGYFKAEGIAVDIPRLIEDSGEIPCISWICGFRWGDDSGPQERIVAS